MVVRRWLPVLVWCVSTLVLTNGCTSPPDSSSAPARPKVAKHRLTRLPSTYRTGGIAIADDGLSWISAVRTGEGVVDITTGAGRIGSYQETSPPAFTPIARLPFFWTLQKPADTMQIGLFVKDRIVPTPFARPTPVVLSRDGAHWAIAAAVGAVEALPSEVTPMVVMVDGVERGRYHDTSKPAFSFDGQHVAWLAEDEGRKLSLVVDGAVRRTYDAPAPPPGHTVSEPLHRSTMASEMALQYAVQYLSDGRILAIVRDRAGWTVERDGTALASYDFNPTSRPDNGAPDIDPFALTNAFTPESLAVADAAPVAIWWERLPGAPVQWRVVRDGTPVDGVVCLSAWTGQQPIVSPDGQHVAYPCTTNDGADFGDPPRVYIVVDGRRFGPYVNIWGLRLSDDGAHAVWAAATSKDANAPWRYAIDGLLLKTEVNEAFRPRLDPTNRHLAWLGRQGKHLRFGLDDTPLGTVDEVLWGPKFVDTRTAAWVVRKKHTLVRVDVAF